METIEFYYNQCQIDRKEVETSAYLSIKVSQNNESLYWDIKVSQIYALHKFNLTIIFYAGNFRFVMSKFDSRQNLLDFYDKILKMVS